MAPMQAFHSDRHLLPLPPGHRFPRSKYRLLRERVAGLRRPRGARGAAGRRRRAGPRPRPGVCRCGDSGDARRRRAARDRLPVERGDGRALAPLGRRDARRRARGARRRRRRQPRRRHPPRVGVARQRLLRLQRRRGRIARAAGRGRAAADRRRRPRRPPGRRHGGDLRRRPERVHDLAPRREELPVPQGDERPRRRPARRLRRRRVPAPRSTARSTCSASEHGGAAVRPRLLSRRRRSARGRPARPAQAQRRRPARARPPRPRARSAQRDIPVALAMAGGYGHDLDVTVAIQAATIEAAIDAWRAWRDRPRGGAARRRRRLLHDRRWPPTIARP